MSEFENTEFDTTVDPAVVAAAVAKFGLQLRAVRRRAGDPSLRDMVRDLEDLHDGAGRSRHSRVRPVSVSTLGRALVGKKFPKWSVVDGLLVACRADDTTRTKVQHAWYVVAEMIDPVGFTGNEDAPHDEPAPGAALGTLRIVGDTDGPPRRRTTI